MNPSSLWQKDSFGGGLMENKSANHHGSIEMERMSPKEKSLAGTANHPGKKLKRASPAYDGRNGAISSSEYVAGEKPEERS